MVCMNYERVYLVKKYGMGNVSYIFLIDLIHEYCIKMHVSKNKLRTFFEKFTEIVTTGLVMDMNNKKNSE